jgi:hypothetical protein
MHAASNAGERLGLLPVAKIPAVRMRSAATEKRAASKDGPSVRAQCWDRLHAGG